MTRRRSIVKSLGALPALGVVNTVSANQRAPSAERLRKRSRELLLNDEADKAERLYEDYGLRHNSTSTVPEPPSDDDSEAGIQNRYSESNSEFRVFTGQHPDMEDVYVVQAIMELDTHRGRTVRDVTEVDDVIGITYNNDHWSLAELEPIVGVFKGAEGIHEAEFSSGAFDPKEGVAATVDLDYPSGSLILPDEAGICLDVWLKNLDGHREPVACNYKHTRAYTFSRGISGISVAGFGLEVDLRTGSSVAWDAFDIVSP